NSTRVIVSPSAAVRTSAGCRSMLHEPGADAVRHDRLGDPPPVRHHGVFALSERLLGAQHGRSRGDIAEPVHQHRGGPLDIDLGEHGQPPLSPRRYRPSPSAAPLNSLLGAPDAAGPALKTNLMAARGCLADMPRRSGADPGIGRNSAQECTMNTRSLIL